MARMSRAVEHSTKERGEPYEDQEQDQGWPDVAWMQLIRIRNNQPTNGRIVMKVKTKVQAGGVPRDCT
jgi:hypothetical protein